MARPSLEEARADLIAISLQSWSRDIGKVEGPFSAFSINKCHSVTREDTLDGGLKGRHGVDSPGGSLFWTMRWNYA